MAPSILLPGFRKEPRPFLLSAAAEGILLQTSTGAVLLCYNTENAKPKRRW